MKRNNKKGFTIVELTIVIAVIAILAAVLIPTFSSIVDKANTSSDIQLVRQANMILAALDVYDGEIDEATAIEELQANGITLETPTNTENEFHYDPAEKRYVIWSKAEEKVIYPENSAYIPSYKLTYDWNVNHTFKPQSDHSKNQYLDTGYSINWDNDFTIEMRIENASTSGYQLILSSLSPDTWNAESNAFAIGIYGGSLQFYTKGANRIGVSSYVENGKPLNIKIEWSKQSSTLTLTVSKEGGVAQIKPLLLEDNMKVTGKTETLRIGSKDHRTFNYGVETKVSAFKITTEVAYGTPLNHPKVTSNLENFTVPTWTDISSMPTEDTTITATWNN